MLTSLSRSLRPSRTVNRVFERISLQNKAPTTFCRHLSSLPPDDPQSQFQPSPPKALTMEMAIGIQDANQLFLAHGVGQQRLKLLAEDENTPLVIKWQRMMQIYLGMQLHTVTGLGYSPDEQGIMTYTQQLAQFISTCDPDVQEKFREVGRKTWRDMLASAFDLEEELKQEKFQEEMGIVDARNMVHKVASKLVEPIILETVAKRCGELPSGKFRDENGICKDFSWIYANANKYRFRSTS